MHLHSDASLFQSSPSPNLRKAALGITVRWDLDYPYMEEFSEAYDGLSKVEDLFIRFSFIQDEKIRRSLWHKGEKPEDWKGFLGGSRKIKAIGLFLKVTNQLNTLEFYAGEKLSAMTQSLTSLTRSFNSLKHLRLLGPGVVTNTPYPIDLAFFKNLRIFSLDLGILHVSKRDLNSPFQIVWRPYIWFIMG